MGGGGAGGSGGAEWGGVEAEWGVGGAVEGGGAGVGELEVARVQGVALGLGRMRGGERGHQLSGVWGPVHTERSLA
ncbi:hypothetical protein HGQ98_31615 [Achromobacter ruhlandii]|uniref:Uncharacterized protein n=1 Tax=Achromobacter ruhlandii TaxID=72557 RepID=A0A848NRI0_9BURK|nr:hypothetical protein [Achromobacter ruhlandii]